ncbi:hypothetical protein GQX74_013968 [Glossina fuscipes]|nr:hypothetical protein GQX74_013968 [Glossina fuscipes]
MFSRLSWKSFSENFELVANICHKYARDILQLESQSSVTSKMKFMTILKTKTQNIVLTISSLTDMGRYAVYEQHSATSYIPKKYRFYIIKALLACLECKVIVLSSN